MNGWSSFLDGPLVYRLGCGLLHFLWQGAVVAGVLSVALGWLRRGSPVARHRASWIALAVMAACVPVTAWLSQAPVRSPDTAGQQQPVASVAGALLEPVEYGDLVLPETPPPYSLVSGADGATRTVAGTEQSAMVAPSPAFEPTQSASPLLGNLRQRMGRALPWIVGAWLVGAVGLSLWRLGGWLCLRRLCRHGTAAVPQTVSETFDRLVARLGVSRPVRLLESTLARMPIVVGWLRPVVLLPVAVVGQMSPEQLEMVLAHELAHVRRSDFLWNLAQTAVETLLFYHPAVWWVSRQIRAEREACCDDLAATAMGDRLLYARSLARLEEMRHGRELPLDSSLQVAADGGSLLRRIRRVLGLSDEECRAWHGWLGSLLAVSLVVAALAGYMAVAEEKESVAFGDERESILTEVAPKGETSEARAEIEPPLQGAKGDQGYAAKLPGLVTDEQGSPLAGVTITMCGWEMFRDGRWHRNWAPHCLFPRPWKSDEEGRFDPSGGEAAGRVNLWLEKPGFAPTYLPGASPRPKEVKVVMPRGIPVSGTVKRLTEEGLTPLEGATVHVQCSSGDLAHQKRVFGDPHFFIFKMRQGLEGCDLPYRGRVTTDAEGKYTFLLSPPPADKKWVLFCADQPMMLDWKEGQPVQGPDFVIGAQVVQTLTGAHHLRPRWTLGRVEFGPRLTLLLGAGPARNPGVVQLTEISFGRDAGQITAMVGGTIRSRPKGKFRVQVALLDKKGDQLQESSVVVEASGAESGVPEADTGELRFQFDLGEQAADVAQYCVTLCLAPDDAQATARLVPLPQNVLAPEGDVKRNAIKPKVAAIVAEGIAPLPQDASAWSEPVGGLRGRLVVAKPVIGSSEPFRVDLRLENVSEKPISVTHGNPFHFEARVIDSSGKPVEPTSGRVDVIYSTRTSVVRPKAELTFPVTIRSIDGAKGSHLDTTTRIWTLGVGKYTLGGTYKLPAGQLTLPPLELEIRQQEHVGELDASIEVRLRAEKAAWPHDETPVLTADLRDRRSDPEGRYGSTGGLCHHELEVDGRWHNYGRADRSATSFVVPPGKEVKGALTFPLSADWVRQLKDDPQDPALHLRPGRHTVRVAVNLYPPVKEAKRPDGRMEHVRFVSNPVEIDVLTPGAAPPTKADNDTSQVDTSPIEAADGRPVDGLQLDLSIEGQRATIRQRSDSWTAFDGSCQRQALRLEFRNAGGVPLKLETYLLTRCHLTFEVIGPEMDSVQTKRHLIPWSLAPPRAADFPTLEPGETWTANVRFPGVFSDQAYGLLQQGDYHVRAVYENGADSYKIPGSETSYSSRGYMKQTLGDAYEGCWQGKVKSNAVTLQVGTMVAPPVVKGLELTLVPEATKLVMKRGASNPEPFKLGLRFANPTDKPLKLDTYLFTRCHLGVHAVGPDKESVDYHRVAVDAALPQPTSEQYITIQPGQSWTTEVLFPGDFNGRSCSLKKLGHYQLRMTYYNGNNALPMIKATASNLSYDEQQRLGEHYAELTGELGDVCQGCWRGTARSNEIVLSVLPEGGPRQDAAHYQDLHARYKALIADAARSGDKAQLPKITEQFNDSIGGQLIYAGVVRSGSALISRFFGREPFPLPAISYDAADSGKVKVSRFDDYFLVETANPRDPHELRVRLAFAAVDGEAEAAAEALQSFGFRTEGDVDEGGDRITAEP